MKVTAVDVHVKSLDYEDIMLISVDQYTLKKCVIVFYYENTPYETTVSKCFKDVQFLTEFSYMYSNSNHANHSKLHNLTCTTTVTLYSASTGG